MVGNKLIGNLDGSIEKRNGILVADKIDVASYLCLYLEGIVFLLLYTLEYYIDNKVSFHSEGIPLIILIILILTLPLLHLQHLHRRRSQLFLPIQPQRLPFLPQSPNSLF